MAFEKHSMEILELGWSSGCISHPQLLHKYLNYHSLKVPCTGAWPEGKVSEAAGPGRQQQLSQRVLVRRAQGLGEFGIVSRE